MSHSSEALAVGLETNILQDFSPTSNSFEHLTKKACRVKRVSNRAYGNWSKPHTEHLCQCSLQL